MKYKKSIIVIMLAIFLVSIAAVSASDVNEKAIASGNDSQIELSQSGEVETDNLQTGEEQIVTQTDNDENLSASDELDVLGADEATFSILAREISRGGNVELQHDYYICSDSDSTIHILGFNRIIDGRGAVIDMAGSTIQAFYVEYSGVTIKNLTIKNANYNGDGGAIYFLSSGTVENCNFVNNTATNCCGAVYFNKRGNVANCNFTDNTAGNSGGAVFLVGKNSEVTNCNFADNTAEINAGAIYMISGSVKYCNFTNNSCKLYVGAISMTSGSVENCNFADNAAEISGAIQMDWGSVENCNFTGNNATTGSAIYFWSTSGTKTVSNSIFLNNRANAETLEVTKNYNNITITFTGNNNLLNAIYSRDDGEVSFTNVTYWSANGISSTGNFPIKPPRSNRQAGQNITLEIFDSDDKLVENVTLVTDINGQAIYDLAKLSIGKFRYNVYHFEDSYYTYAESNGTFTNALCDFNILQKYINEAAADSVLTLNRNYTFTVGIDENLADGIVIDKPITINGNGYTINALNNARIFKVTAKNVVLNNITFTNANASVEGGAVHFYKNVEGNVANCSFNNNSAYEGGAIYFDSGSFGRVVNCNFTGNNATTGSAIFFWDTSVTKTVSNSIFLNNRANAETLEVTKNENNITITFTGNNNLLNAIYSIDDAEVTISNVTYWSANGIVNTGNSAIKPSRSKNEAGQNITVEIYDSNDNLVDNVTLVTDDNGQVSYDFSKLSDGKYRYNAYHLEDSYYTYSESNDTFTVGVGDFNRLQSYIKVAKAGSELTLYRNYTFTVDLDENLTAGIGIDKPITINGNGYTINALQKARIFYVTSENVVLNNITFTNATTSERGGAVFFKESGRLENCSFTNNQAYYGGAVLFMGSGRLVNCNFTNNQANNGGGAVLFMNSGSAINCDFTNNSATSAYSYGGALDFIGEGNVTNCNFTNNKADYSGAVYFANNSEVTNCNFNGNNATTGSAFYFYWISTTKTVSNSRFLNNRANAESLEVTKNDNNITITFTGNDNLLNAIYSNGDITLTNVTYWSANGIANTDSSAPVRSNKEAGQNITVSVVVNDEIVLNKIITTDENGMIVLDIIAGDNYFIGARHDTDSYYTEAEKTISTMKFNVNVTSQTTNNKTVNITAKSNIPNEFIKGKLLFILPNGDEINASYASNGTWWALHTFDDAGDYNVNATYTGLDNVSINNATISIRYDASVDVNNKTLDLLIDDRFTIVATTTPKGLNVSYVPDDSGVYSIDVNGNVIALREGQGSILIKVGGDGIYAENSTVVNVTVSKVPTEITVDPVSLDLLVGDETVIVAGLTPADAGNVTFTSSNESVVVVDAEGNVIANGEGQAIITVSFAGDNKYAAAENKTVTVDVSLNEASVTVDNDTLDLKVGETYAINATKHPDTILLDITYKSSDDSVASVDENGVVTAVGEGSAIITVSVGDGEIYAENSTNVTVTVKKSNSNLTANAMTFKDTDKTKKYTVTLNDSNGNPIANATVTLKVNGKTYTAKTNAKGQATFKLTKLTKTGTYAAVIKFAGDKKYVSTSVKVKITVKSPWKTIFKGSKDKAMVKKIQKALKKNGYYLTYKGHYLKIDGIYHDCTVRAVKQFQKANGLKVTGKVDEKTAKKLGII